MGGVETTRERSTTSAKAAAAHLSKPDRQVDETFLVLVREQACLVHVHRQRCPADLDSAQGGVIESAHLDSVGSGGSDYSAVPLCHEAHMELHRIGEESFSTRHGIDLRGECWKVVVLYFTGRRP